MGIIKELKLYIPSGADRGSMKRKDMPQVDWKHLDDLLNHLKDDYGITSSKKKVDPHKLKAFQAQFSKAGVERSLEKGIVKDVKPLLVGSDYKIVDGHHRWLASVNGGVKSIPIIQFNKPAGEVIKNIKTFGKAKYKNIYNKVTEGNITEMKTNEDDGGKHLVVQLRKVITLGGKKPVEFNDGNKVTVDPNVARKFLSKYMGMKKPMDKERFQAKAAASYEALKDCLSGKPQPAPVKESSYDKWRSMVVNVDEAKRKGPPPLKFPIWVAQSIPGKNSSHFTTPKKISSQKEYDEYLANQKKGIKENDKTDPTDIDNLEMNEVSKDLAARYLRRATTKLATTEPSDFKKVKKRTKGMQRAISRMSKVDEAKNLYHKTFSDAVSAAVDKAEKQGYLVDDNDIADSLGRIPGRGRPSVGKTTIFKIPVKKRGQKKTHYLQIQVYGMEGGRFELNSYV